MKNYLTIINSLDVISQWIKLKPEDNDILRYSTNTENQWERVKIKHGCPTFGDGIFSGHEIFTYENNTFCFGGKYLDKTKSSTEFGKKCNVFYNSSQELEHFANFDKPRYFHTVKHMADEI